MKWISLLSLALLFGTSCKEQQEEQQQNPSFSFGSPLKANRKLNNEEEKRTREACLLLRDKREYFQTLEDNIWEFDFDGEEKECGGRTLPKRRYIARLRVPTRGPLTFDSRTRRYLNEILTDRDGFLSFYCEKLFNNQDTYLVQDVGGRKVQMEIVENAGYLLVQGAWYAERDGSYRPYLLDKVLIHTKRTTGNSRYYGVIKDRAQHRPCDDGSTKYLRQGLR